MLDDHVVTRDELLPQQPVFTLLVWGVCVFVFGVSVGVSE